MVLTQVLKRRLQVWPCSHRQALQSQTLMLGIWILYGCRRKRFLRLENLFEVLRSCTQFINKLKVHFILLINQLLSKEVHFILNCVFTCHSPFTIFLDSSLDTCSPLTSNNLEQLYIISSILPPFSKSLKKDSIWIVIRLRSSIRSSNCCNDIVSIKLPIDVLKTSQELGKPSRERTVIAHKWLAYDRPRL